ncbi:hypothetical protein [Moritella yayanosii]|uniref:Uncharacterized protein n=1 Tax=Moritella yayanosii TaxID=69539 RepID=A0A330LQ98_9GAMM|nr:hypothetical protein [Moritella yayanosii]SQD78903.1 protein of unknown function [Moritella yayanosii]
MGTSSAYLYFNGVIAVDKAGIINYLTEHAQLSGRPSALDVFTEVEDGELIEGEIAMDYKGPGYNVTFTPNVAGRYLMKANYKGELKNDQSISPDRRWWS